MQPLKHAKVLQLSPLEAGGKMSSQTKTPAECACSRVWRVCSVLIRIFVQCLSWNLVLGVTRVDLIICVFGHGGLCQLHLGAVWRRERGQVVPWSPLKQCSYKRICERWSLIQPGSLWLFWLFISNKDQFTICDAESCGFDSLRAPVHKNSRQRWRTLWTFPPWCVKRC